MSYDYLIVGAGLTGAVIARQLHEAGKRVLVVEARDVIGGACYDERQPGGYYATRYGGHIFHTSNAAIWQYVQRFADWQPYHHKVVARVGAKVYSFPINLMTLQQLWGVTTPEEARAALAARRVEVADKQANMESWCLATIGEELYETFIRGYTTKQWKRQPSELPASIVRRLPVRLTYDDGYYDSTFQAMPVRGYTDFIQSILGDIALMADFDYLKYRDTFDAMAQHIVYTGPIDAFFNYEHGALDYRSCHFGFTPYAGDYQGAATVNYPSADVPYTRIVEYQHFYGGGAANSLVMVETPADNGEPLYPVRDASNAALYERYAALKPAHVTFAGRLGSYQYLDMAPAIGLALKTARELL